MAAAYASKRRHAVPVRTEKVSLRPVPSLRGRYRQRGGFTSPNEWLQMCVRDWASALVGRRHATTIGIDVAALLRWAMGLW